MYGYNYFPFFEDEPEYYWLYRNGEEGLYFMGGISDTDTLLINELRYKYPAEVGETWSVPRMSFSVEEEYFYIYDTLEVTLNDTGYKLETQAGVFTTEVYKFTVSNGEDVANDWDYYMYYRPSVGLVAQISTTENDIENIEDEMYLLDYRAD